MQRRAAVYLWDAEKACGLVLKFVRGRTFDEYRQDLVLSSAVERQLTIMAEALNKFARIEPEIATRITDLPKIIAFRNLLVQAYADVDDAIVWKIISGALPDLRTDLRALLREVAE